VIDEVFQDLDHKMDQTVVAIQRELASIRTGRANLAILDGVEVSAYGGMVPLNQVAGLSVQDAQLIVVKPYDTTVLPAIEKAIHKADLGLNPVSDGKLLRLPIPPLTEERRKEMAKKVHEIREEGKIALRNIRHHIRDDIKLLQEEKEITEDEEHKAYDRIQKVTDDHAGKIDTITEAKEKEILEI
jgi:ribosome recycling factor